MTIDKAIEALRLITFDYEGLPRTVEPHTYGTDYQSHLLLVAYQVAGNARSGKLGWKNFNETRIHNLKVSTEHFQAPRSEYKRNDGAFKTIIAQL